jgi:hypothetical protein
MAARGEALDDLLEVTRASQTVDEEEDAHGGRACARGLVW